MRDTIMDDGILSQFDLTAGMDFTLSIDDVYDITRELEMVESIDFEQLDNEELAEFAYALKGLEDAVSTARKDYYETVLKGRIEVGDRVGRLTKIKSGRTYIDNEDAAIRALEHNDIDPIDAMELKVNAFKTVASKHGIDPDAFTHRKTWTYFKRE